jgi:hypothetical protein
MLFRLVRDGQLGRVQALLQSLRDPTGKGHAL